MEKSNLKKLVLDLIIDEISRNSSKNAQLIHDLGSAYKLIENLDANFEKLKK